MANWWEAGGATGCVAAYQPVGATSLAASYVDLSGSGNDSAPGVAPSFDTATGWTFNGSTQYLTTGLTPAATPTWSMLVRFTSPGTNVKRYIAGMYTSLAQLLIVARWDGGSQVTYYGNGHTGTYREVSPRMDGGVIGVAGVQGYRDGVADGAPFAYVAGSGGAPVLIAAMNYEGTPFHHSDITVQAFALFDNALDAAEVAAVSAAMAALPTASAKGLPIIAHHYRQVFGGGR